MAKKKTYFILGLIILVIGGYFYYKNKKPAVVYTTETASKGNLAQTVSVTGKFVPEKQYDLAFKASGKITQMSVDVGDAVKKDQKLAQIDRGTLNANLRGAQEEVTAQKKSLSNMQRRHDTYNSQQESAQKAEIRKAQAAVDAIYEQLRDTWLYSPIDGMVIKRNVNDGEIATINDSGTTTVLTVAPNTDPIIESNIPESDIAKVAVGQKATATFDALTSEEKFEAEVFEIEPASTVIQDVVYYKVKLKVNNLDPRLKIGMSNDIDIKTAEKDNVVMIPLRAVKTEGSQKYVEILKDEKNNIVEKIFVTTGLTGDDGMVEVTLGLKGGEKVITLTK
jgi:RND family efflux transporter MFP subunit